MQTKAPTKTKEPAPDLLANAGIVEEAPKPKPIARAKPPKPEPSKAVAIRDPRAEAPAGRSLLSICLEAASNKRTSPEKVKAYLDMARAEEDRILEREFDNLMMDARSEMPVIIKDAWNPHTKSHYAKLEKVSQQIDGIARKHGFNHTYGMADSPVDNHYRIILDLINRNGFKRRYYMDIGSDAKGAKGGGTKSEAQGTGSSVAYARRYLKTMAWDLVIAEQDRDGGPVEAGESIGSDEMQELTALIKATNTKIDDFCNHYNIEGLSDLPKAKFKNAIALLKRKKDGER